MVTSPGNPPLPDMLNQLQASLADRYRIERELGRGGMATVFLAQDLRHDRPVALKLLHPDLAAVRAPTGSSARSRLCARLQHPHILAAPRLAAAPTGSSGSPCRTSRARSLRSRLQREKQLPVDDALRITREVADALHYAHSTA